MSSTIRSSTALVVTLAAGALTFGACGGTKDATSRTTGTPMRAEGTTLVLRDTQVTATFDAAGIAEPFQQATVSTKLMGTITAVLVQEGDAVRAGQPLVRIDARELTAKANQVAASIADAEAQQKEATAYASRFRALYADSAATKAQFEAAETALARAEAGLRAARAGGSELDAVRSYSTVVAPFNGTVTARMVDIGSFAAPGAPLLTIQDGRSLRLSATAPADAARQITRGQRLSARVDGIDVTARVEGVVPAGAGNLFTVNAIVTNADQRLAAGSAAVLFLPMGSKTGLLVPHEALIRDGDLVGVVVRGANGDDRRWIRLGVSTPMHVEVTSGLKAGETIVVPTSTAPRGTKAGT